MRASVCALGETPRARHQTPNITPTPIIHPTARIIAQVKDDDEEGFSPAS